MNAGALINEYVINNLRFAHDIATLGENEADLQNSIDNMATERT